jgi:hypothetical protein
MAEITEMTSTQVGNGGPAGDAQDGARAEDVREKAQGKAQEVASGAGDTVRKQVDQRSTEAGERITSTGSDLRSVGEELRKQGKDTPAKMADRAAERVERAGDYLKRSDADTLVRDVEDFGRRQPLAVLAGGLVAGLALARFLKASSGQRYRSYQANATRSLPSPAPVSPSQGDHSTRFEPHA